MCFNLNVHDIEATLTDSAHVNDYVLKNIDTIKCFLANLNQSLEYLGVGTSASIQEASIDAAN